MKRVICFALPICLVAGQALASTGADAPAREIIVTGERVSRTLLDTPSSVVAVTSGDIDAQTASDVDDVLASVPNVQLGSGSEGAAIRGQDTTGVLRDVSAFLGGTRPRATLQVDGRALGYYEYVAGLTSVWDVEQVEVFRSPQTTTQGRNSIAGAIFVQTYDPTSHWEGRLRATAGNYGLRQASAMVSGPIVPDQVAFRLSGDIRRIHNASNMADGVAGASLEHDDFGVARAKLLVEPRALPGLRLETTYVHSESQAPQFEAIAAPFKVRRFPAVEPTNGVFRTNVESLTARADYRLASALSWRSTLSWGSARMRRFGIPQFGQARIGVSDFSAEAVLDWQPEGPVRMLGGIHRLTSRMHQTIDVSRIGLGIGAFADRQTSLGLFGEATWRPWPRLAVTGGLRFQRDRQDREGRLSRPAVLAYDKAFEAVLPKLSIAYDFADSATAGLLLQRAFHPGGVTVSQFTLSADEFDAETLWNYEAFVRARFAGGRGMLSANLFYNDIAGAQRLRRFRFTPPTGSPVGGTDIVNVPTAESYGAELELAWRATRRLSLRLGLGLLKTKILRTLPADAAFLGKDFQRSPGLSTSAAIDWRPADGLQLSAQLRGNSGYFSDDQNNPLLRIDGSTVVNLRAAYSRGGITVFGFARNLFDSYYLTYLFEPNAGPTPTVGTAGDPREVGFGLEMRF